MALVVRSSYSLMYDFPTGEFCSNLAGAPSYGNRTVVTDPAGLLDNPYRDVGGDPHPIIAGPATPFPVGGTFASMEPDINVAVGKQTHRGLKLAVQRRSTSGVSLNGNYAWSRCFGA